MTAENARYTEHKKNPFLCEQNSETFVILSSCMYLLASQDKSPMSLKRIGFTATEIT